MILTKSNVFISLTFLLLTFSCHRNEPNSKSNFMDRVLNSNHYKALLLKEKNTYAISLDRSKRIKLQENNLYLIDSLALSTNKKEGHYLPLLLSEHKYYIPSESEVEQPILPNSYPSLMEFIEFAWTLKNSTDKQEIYNQLYEKYTFNETVDLSFKTGYPFSDYIKELKSIIVKMDKGDFGLIKQNQKTQPPLSEYLKSITEEGKAIFTHFVKKRNKRKINARIVLNLKPEYVLKMPEFIKDHFDTRIKKFKMTSYSAFNRRRDNFILYVSDLDFAKEYGEKIHADFLEKYPNSFNKEVPYMTNKLADGMAIAEEAVVKKESVGSLRCKAISQALLNTEGSFNDFKRRVLFNFEKNKIDFFAPHQNLKP